MTTGKIIALTRWTFVDKVTSLLFNMLSQFSSVQFIRSVVSNSLRPHWLQPTRLLCPWDFSRWEYWSGVSLPSPNMLSRLVIAFLPRSKHLFTWLQSPSAVILEPRKIKSATVSTVFLSICYEVTGLDAMILVFWMLSLSQFFHSPLSLSSRDS